MKSMLQVLPVWNIRVAQNTKKIENFIFSHCIRYTITFLVLCKKNQIHSFKIGASQATLIFQTIREKMLLPTIVITLFIHIRGGQKK